jgi:hypothetical protein
VIAGICKTGGALSASLNFSGTMIALYKYLIDSGKKQGFD